MRAALLAAVAPGAADVGRFRTQAFEYRGHACVVAGTGYTGEDGVECSVPVEVATGLWRSLMDAGVQPAGLGARDTLRLEAGLPLHGNELGAGITPLNAGLEWVVSWTKGEFLGREALERQRDATHHAGAGRPAPRGATTATHRSAGGGGRADRGQGQLGQLLARAGVRHRAGVRGARGGRGR